MFVWEFKVNNVDTTTDGCHRVYRDMKANRGLQCIKITTTMG
jgi:hypothetical protein